MLLSDVINQFIAERKAARYSPHTINDYNVTFKKLLQYLSDVEISSVEKKVIIEFMASQTEISAKTLRNYHANLSALWRWAVQQGYCNENIISQIQPPIAEKKAIVPLSREEIQAIVLSALHSDNHLRDSAIILLLVDTGIRASELCGLKIKDLNQTTRHIIVFGKGRKERQIPISQTTFSSILLYIHSRGKVKPNDPLFLSNTNKTLNKDQLRNIICKLGEDGKVTRVYPHLFRHTFAIQFLRNGGTIYTLQQILGHTTLDMVKRYLAIAQVDLDRDHLLASPVTRWHLQAIAIN
jgi:site-specific recombinase XerD